MEPPVAFPPWYGQQRLSLVFWNPRDLVLYIQAMKEEIEIKAYQDPDEYRRRATEAKYKTRKVHSDGIYAIVLLELSLSPVHLRHEIKRAWLRSLTSQKTFVACDAASWGDSSVKGKWIGVLSEEPRVNCQKST